MIDIEDEISILKTILPNGSIINNCKYKKDIFEYCYRSNSGGIYCNRGNWIKKIFSCLENPIRNIRGLCLFSFVSHVEGCNTPLESVECVAKILGVNFSIKNSLQPNKIKGYIFVEKAHNYQKIETDDVLKNILGDHQESYEFCNIYGKYFFELRVWRLHGDPIHLFMTRQKYTDGYNEKFVDIYIAPPWSKVIYNLHLIHNQKNDCIFIHDDISRTNVWKEKGVNTWSGEISYVSKIDWEILKHRNVKYVFDPTNLYSCKIAMKLKIKFEKMATPLDLITYETHYEENKDFFSSSNLKEKLFKICKLESYEQFYNLVKNNHGYNFDYYSKRKDIGSYVRTLKDLSEIKVDRKFIAYPLFKKGELIVLFSAPGVGKSFVALDLSLMLARGGSWDERLSAKQRYKVFYIDAESEPDEFEQRIKWLIDGNYGSDIETLKYIKWLCLLDFNNVDEFYLSNAKNREKINLLTKDVDLLVLDNLGKLAPSQYETNPNLWMEISLWISSLKKKGISVLLVHHENKNKNLSGTGKIAQNANLIIKLSIINDNNNKSSTEDEIVHFKIFKSRSLNGKEKESFSLFYKENNGKIERTVILPKLKLLDVNKNLVLEEEIKKYKLNELDIDILNKARNSNVEFVTNSDFKDENITGRRFQTVTEHLNKLVKLNLLSTKGKNKGAKYWMAGRKAPSEK